MLNVNPDSRFKISQVKDSRWFNLTGKRYEVKGIVVGNDTIVPD